MLVDLHIHTYYSDGTMSPKEVVEEAKKKNLGIIAITDHDVLDSYEELINFLKRKVDSRYAKLFNC